MKTSHVLVLLFLMVALPAAAQQHLPTRIAGKPTAPAEAGEEDDSPVSLSLAFDVVSAGFSRGFLYEDQGFIGQPSGTVVVELFDSDGFLSGFNLESGVWASLHSGPTGSGGATGDPEAWYEADWWGGVEAAFLGDKLLVGADVVLYTSPNDEFDSTLEFELDIALDDIVVWSQVRELLPGWTGLNPGVKIAFELDGQADGGSAEGVYLETRIHPGVDLPVIPGLRLDVPVSAGFSLDSYYEAEDGTDSTFGYFDVGFDLSAPLSFVPEDFGAWGAHACVHLLWLGDSNTELNDGDDFATWFGGGITIDF